jgi:hypothetical protein
MNKRRKLYSGCFYCHGYWCKFCKDGTCKAIYRVRANWELPRSFLIRTKDRHAVERFVEGLYSNNYDHRQMISDGVVTDLKYEDAPKVGDQAVIIHVSPERLREVMTRECPLGIPEGFGLKFTSGEGSAPMTLRQASAAMVSDTLHEQLMADRMFIGKQAVAEGCTFQWVTVGHCVMAEFIPWEEASLGRTDSETPPEHFIISNVRLDNGAQELIYSIMRAGSQYFARYVVYEGQTVLLETGPAPTGPWQPISYNTGMCAALGLLQAEEVST